MRFNGLATALEIFCALQIAGCGVSQSPESNASVPGKPSLVKDTSSDLKAPTKQIANENSDVAAGGPTSDERRGHDEMVEKFATINA